MTQSALAAILLVAVVAVFGGLLRRMTGPVSSGTPAAPPAPAPEPEADEEEEIDEFGAGNATAGNVPLSAEGVAFVPRPHGVLLLPLVESQERPDWLDRAVDSSAVPYTVLNELYFTGAGGGVQPSRPGSPLSAGDLTGARIVRGDAASGPWRLETLGRDGDFGFHPFTTRNGAEAALDLLVTQEVVLRPVDDQGAIPPSSEDFEEARRRYEATESELHAGEAEPPREGPWVSDRR